MENFKKLSRDEMQKVIGGISSSSTCSVDCGNGISITCNGPCTESTTSCIDGNGGVHNCPNGDE